MALGGGNFSVQNKVLPGSYINFVTTANASTVFAERGTGAIIMPMAWGEEGTVIEVTQEDFERNCPKIFGYQYTDDEMAGIRDFFKYGKTLLAGRLNANGKKAENILAEALYTGSAGNKISTDISADVDDEESFNVYTYFDGDLVDSQYVSSWDELQDNDYVKWKKNGNLTDSGPYMLEGGTDGTTSVAQVSTFLGNIEAYSVNTIAVDSSDQVTMGMLVSFVKRMRDEKGIKLQAVVYGNKKYDYEGVVCVFNKFSFTGDFTDASSVHKGIYWVSGAVAGCAINRSLTNKTYNGEYTIYTAYTQNELETAVNGGNFVFHKVGDDVRVLLDYNTLVTFTTEKNEYFRDNQTVRICDQIATDIASIFNDSYLGLVPNDSAGRISLWSDIVKHHKNLQQLRALDDFDEEDVSVEPGESKNSVVVYDAVMPVNAMAKLYMTVTVN
jgi:hypothetical protein